VTAYSDTWTSCPWGCFLAQVTKVVAVESVGAGSVPASAWPWAWPSVMGFAACALLLALQKPLWLLLADASPRAFGGRESTSTCASQGLPPQLLVMCTSGILQGFKVCPCTTVPQYCRYCDTTVL